MGKQLELRLKSGRIYVTRVDKDFCFGSLIEELSDEALWAVFDNNTAIKVDSIENIKLSVEL